MNQVLHLLLGDQQSRHRNDGRAFLRYALLEVEAGYGARRQNEPSQLVDRFDGGFATWQEQEKNGGNKGEACAHPAQQEQQDGENGKLEAQGVIKFRLLKQCFANQGRAMGAIINLFLEKLPSRGNKVEANVREANRGAGEVREL